MLEKGWQGGFVCHLISESAPTTDTQPSSRSCLRARLHPQHSPASKKNTAKYDQHTLHSVCDVCHILAATRDAEEEFGANQACQPSLRWLVVCDGLSNGGGCCMESNVKMMPFEQVHLDLTHVCMSFCEPFVLSAMSSQCREAHLRPKSPKAQPEETRPGVLHGRIPVGVTL